MAAAALKMDEIKNDKKPLSLVPKEDAEVIQLIPKKVQEKLKEINDQEELFLRQQRCKFRNTISPEGCKCNYCVYFNMQSQRVFDMLRSDMFYQQKKGQMVFSSSDLLEILQLTVEKIYNYEKQNSQGPKGKQ